MSEIKKNALTNDLIIELINGTVVNKIQENERIDRNGTHKPNAKVT